MTDFSALPRTFDIAVRRRGATADTRYYRLSLHAAGYLACLDEVVSLFPGVDGEHLRRVYTGKTKPGIGITGDLSIINTDHYSKTTTAVPPPDGKARRKTCLEVLASLTQTVITVNRDLHDAYANLASLERRGVIPPAHYAETAERLVKWACRLSYKIVTLSGQAVAAPPVLPAMPPPPAMPVWVDLPGPTSPPVELTLDLNQSGEPGWGDPVPLSRIKF